MACLAGCSSASGLGRSEVLRNPLQVPSSRPSSYSPFKVVCLFGRKKASAPPPPKPKARPSPASSSSDELAKWYGPDRRIFLPEGLLDRADIPEYLNGEVPGDYGYDPFRLSKKPENFDR
eukprot:TRINITY_DN169_c0_g2_i2.p1 TRINITY_DN169_c0_g2~~TRINITY_DN169_c0_g2_i2.p1  ORF type:complete len:120 (+),score=17.74 TRINITY_DN169_c0_g2_i2:114-473(+)